MSAAYKGAVGEFNATGNNLKDATDNAVDAINSISSAISQIKSGLLSGAFEGVKNLSGTLGKSLSNMSGLLGKAGNALSKFSSTLGGATGEIVGAVLGLLDLLKDGFGSIFADLSDLMFGAVNGILDDILSGGIITKPLQSLVDGVGGILDTITFGGFGSWLGGNDSEVAETVNRLTESNEYLRESIDRLKERIDESAGGQAIDYYEKAAEAESEWQENQLEIIKKLAGAWTNSGYGFLGLSGKKSFNSHAPGGGWEGWDAFTKTLQENGFKITIDEVGDLWGLTPEQMALLRDNNPKEWQKLFSGDGHKNPLDEVNEYIEHAGELEGLMETLNENLTQTSFDSLRSSFLDTLMDMESDAQDFTDDFSSMMQRALLNYAMGDEFDQWLKQWYDSLSDEIRNSGGDLSDIDVGAFREEWEQKAEEWLNMRDWLAGITGYTGDTEKGQQSASSKGYETMSQDMAGELSGRFTALNETGLRIEAQGNTKMQTLADLKGSVAGLEIQAQGIYNIADETRSILANSYLELQEINENTGNSAKFLKDIKADIAIVKQNTSRI